jgi:hypothetical protein
MTREQMAGIISGWINDQSWERLDSDLRSMMVIEELAVDLAETIMAGHNEVIVVDRKEDAARIIMLPPDGAVEIQDLTKDDYIVNLGPDRYVDHEQIYPKSGTVQLTIKRS